MPVDHAAARERAEHTIATGRTHESTLVAQDVLSLLAALEQRTAERDEAQAQLAEARLALEDFANPQHWAIRRAHDGHPDAFWIGTYQQSPVEFARAALAATEETQP